MFGYRFPHRTRAFWLALSLAALAGGREGAFAVTPTIDAPIKWLGGVPAMSVNTDSYATLYNVPAGKSFMLTDLIVSNDNSDIVYFGLQTGSGGQCATGSSRFIEIVVPAKSSLVIPLNTGVNFGAGQPVCVTALSVPPGRSLRVNARGYLFGPK